MSLKSDRKTSTQFSSRSASHYPTPHPDEMHLITYLKNVSHYYYTSIQADAYVQPQSFEAKTVCAVLAVGRCVCGLIFFAGRLVTHGLTDIRPYIGQTYCSQMGNFRRTAVDQQQ